MRQLVRWPSVAAFSVALALAGTASGAPPTGTQYAISMSDLAEGAMGVTSDCGTSGSVLAREERTSGFLHADGSDLTLRLHTDVAWSRKHPIATSGTFDGCFGVTPSLNGNLFLHFEKLKGRSAVHVIWHFDYYIASGVREHFTLESEHILFPAWTGETVTGRVSGTFDLQYSLREGKRMVASYASLTGGAGRQFDFLLTITKLS